MSANYRQTKPKAWMLSLVLHCRRAGPITHSQLYDLVRSHGLTVTSDDLLYRMRRAGLNVNEVVDARNNRRYLICENFT